LVNTEGEKGGKKGKMSADSVSDYLSSTRAVLRAFSLFCCSLYPVTIAVDPACSECVSEPIESTPEKVPDLRKRKKIFVCV